MFFEISYKTPTYLECNNQPSHLPDSRNRCNCLFRKQSLLRTDHHCHSRPLCTRKDCWLNRNPNLKLFQLLQRKGLKNYKTSKKPTFLLINPMLYPNWRLYGIRIAWQLWRNEMCLTWLPGQLFWLQDWVSLRGRILKGFSHSSPSFSASASFVLKLREGVQRKRKCRDLFLLLVPPPQRTEHSVQDPHSPTSQSTEKGPK